MTDDQPPSEQSQPIVAMRELDGDAESPSTAHSAEPPAWSVSAPISRYRLAGGMLLLLSSVAVLTALLLPLYQLLGSTRSNGFGGAPVLPGVSFQITPWGLTQPADATIEFDLIRVLVGPAPQWGIGLIVLALLLLGSAAAQLLRRRPAWTMLAVLVSVALFTGYVVAIATFVASALNTYPLVGGGVHGAAGSGFWVLVFALVLSVLGVFFGYRDQRNDASQPVERVEPDTPALGIPLPGLAPEQDGGEQGGNTAAGQI